MNYKINFKSHIGYIVNVKDRILTNKEIEQIKLEYNITKNFIINRKIPGIKQKNIVILIDKDDAIYSELFNNKFITDVFVEPEQFNRFVINKINIKYDNIMNEICSINITQKINKNLIFWTWVSDDCPKDWVKQNIFNKIRRI